MVLLAFFPLIIGGMVLVIIWGMSGASASPTDLLRGN